MAKKKIHAGQQLDAKVRASGLSITTVTRGAGFSRRTYYLHIAKEYLPAAKNNTPSKNAPNEDQ